MFTGIITAVGHIETVESKEAHNPDAGYRLRLHAPEFDLSSTKLGDSIAIQGACMTVVELYPQGFSIDISRESLNRTVGLDQAGPVNLEPAMRLGDRLDGHMVLGHVDGVGTVSAFEPIGESWLLKIVAPQELAKYFAYKGSVTINGVSLTINEVQDSAEGCEFAINIIPHTLEVTTLKHLQVGHRVNLEVDAIARYVERMLSLTTAR